MSARAAACVGSASANASIATRCLVRRLAAHLVDDPAQLGVELVGIEPPGGLRDVHHEIGAALELVPDPHHGDEEAEVARDRLLAREEQEHLVLDRVRELVDGIVVLDDVLGGGEVGVEQRLGAARDGLGRERGEPDDVDSELVQALVKHFPGLGLALGGGSSGHVASGAIREGGCRNPSCSGSEVPPVGLDESRPSLHPWFTVVPRRGNELETTRPYDESQVIDRPLRQVDPVRLFQAQACVA